MARVRFEIMIEMAKQINKVWWTQMLKPHGQPDLIKMLMCKCKCNTFFKKRINFLFWTKIFRNFEITFTRSGCSRYLKACRRPTLWLLSSHFGRMQEHPLRGKDIKHQSSIYLIKIDKTWDFLVEPPDFHH